MRCKARSRPWWLCGALIALSGVIAAVLTSPGKTHADDRGPELLIPGTRAGDTRTLDSMGEIPVQPRVGADLGGMRGGNDDGWTVKGRTGSPNAAPSSTARSPSGNPSSAGAARNGASVGTPPPASLSVPAAAPLPGSTVSSAPVTAGVPYPYGTPAPVPPLGQPERGGLGQRLSQLFGGGGGQRGSLADWWNSLWGRNSNPANTPAPALTYGAPFSRSPILGGSGTVWNPGPGSVSSVPQAAGGRPGGTSQAPSAFVTPYAMPPSAGTQEGPISLPLSAQPQGSASLTGTGTTRQGMNPSGTAVTGAPLSTATPNASGPTSDFSGGWSAASSSGVGTASGGYVTAYPAPNSSVASPSGAWGAVQPAPPYYSVPPRKPSLMDRIRAWWADVTAPKGAQARQSLLPPGTWERRPILQSPRPVAGNDPFTSRATPVYVLPPGVSTTIPGNSSPAVLPPESQLPLRQAW